MSAAWLTPTQCESELASRLSGRRLICEVDLQDSLGAEAALRYQGLSSSSGAVYVAEHYPLLSAFFLVGRGIASYASGDFWSATKIVTRDQRRVGQAFESALQEFDLETFPQFTEKERAHRFVSVILAHGGIPSSMASQFLRECLLPALRHGDAETGADLVILWRKDPPTWFPPAVRRFLLNGGETAIGLLDRLIDLAAARREDVVAAGNRFGLPRYLADAFLAIPEKEVSRAGIWPRPRVRVDPWDGAGPILHLPAIGPEIATNVRWLVTVGAGQRREVSGQRWALDPDPIPLMPADYWIIEGSGDRSSRSFRLEAFADNPVVCFDNSGAYVSDSGGIHADSAWVLAAPGTTLVSVEGEGVRTLPAGETGAPLSGPWRGYSLSRYDLRGVDVLLPTAHGHPAGSIRVTREASRVEFLTTAVRDVAGQAGESVFAIPPVLSLPAGSSWRVVITDPEGQSRETTIKTADVPHSHDLSGLLENAVGRYELNVMGRLGEDVRTAFMIVPDLVAETPEVPLASSAEVDVAVRADPAKVRLFDRVGGSDHVTIDEGQRRGDLWVRDIARRPNRKLGLFVSVPRLQWAFGSADVAVPTFGQSVLDIDPQAIGTLARSLDLKVERPGVFVRLALMDARGDQRMSSDMRQSDGAGRASFDLRAFRDTVRAHTGQALSLVLCIGASARVTVAAHTPPPTPVAPAAAVTGPAFPTLQSKVTATVVGVGSDGLEVKGKGWTGLIPFRALPTAKDGYHAGQSIEAWVMRIDGPTHFLLDARPFELSQFPLGSSVHARVRRVDPDVLYVDVHGYDARIWEERLPLGRWIHQYRAGEVLDARIIDASDQSRRLELAVVPFDSGQLCPGLELRAPVLAVRDYGVVIQAAPSATGLVYRPYEANGNRLRVGEFCSCWVDRIDAKRETVYCTMRRPGGR
jgi:hypothetical protein